MRRTRLPTSSVAIIPPLPNALFHQPDALFHQPDAALFHQLDAPMAMAGKLS